MTLPVAKPIPTPYALAQEQLANVIAERSEPQDAFPSPPWACLSDLTGSIPPGHMWIIGARPAMGKTTWLLNLVEAWKGGTGWEPRDGVWPGRILYVCTETDATELRSLWGALRLGFDADAVLENDWGNVTRILSAEEAFDAFTKDQIAIANPDGAESVVLYQVPHMDAKTLGPVLRDWGFNQGRGTIILDHINRWQSGNPSELTAELTDAVRGLKGWANERRIRLFVAAQITPLPKQQRSILSDFLPPSLADLKQTQALAEEANVVLGLHQCRRADVTPDDVRACIEGRREPSTLLEPNIMGVSILKARKRRRQALGRTARLEVGVDGRLTDTNGTPF